MLTNAEGNADRSTARVWQRGATRRTILDAARLVAAREGIEAFSLNTVAKETGLSTTTIFAYFATKNDLFTAVLSDDLATIAATMRDIYMFSAPAEEVPSPAAGDVAEESAPQETPTATIVPIVTPRAGGETVAEARLEEAQKPGETPRVDAWLERRLRVFEKSLGDIETRLATAQRDSGAAKSAVEEGLKIFGARLDNSEKRVADISNDLTARMSAAETRLRDASTDLRARLLNACTRIDMLEAAARHVAADAGYTPPAEPVFVSEPAEEPKPDAPQSAKPVIDSYITAARRAAQTAAALADMESSAGKKSKRTWNVSGRMRVILAAGIGVVFVAGASVAYAIGHHDGASKPIRIVVPFASGIAHRHVQHTAALPAAALTSLDKLSALANAGNPAAQLVVGLKYYHGDGIAVNLPQAAKWIARAANAHDAMAQYWMGEVYARGDGVSSDAAQALHWYALAAAQGNRQAMHDLGMAYAEGLGTQKDYSQAANWFAKAAALGLVNSQFNLAVLYERGEGVPQNLVEAYKWYAIAATTGDYESRTRLDAISTAMPERDLQRAKAEAAAFKPAPLNRDANVAPQASAPSRA